MSNRDAYQKEQFEKAGEQAAQVLGRFISIASEFATEIGRHSDQRNSSGDNNTDTTARDDHSEILRNAGDQLKEMREKAGYTLDRFAETLQKEINRPDVKREDVYGKVEAAESGKEPLPNDWVKQVAGLLSSRDPQQFFDRLQGRSGDSKTASNDDTDQQKNDPVLDERVKRFSEIFSTDSDLSDCTEEEFEKLLRFVDKSYREAKTLVIR